MQVDGGTWLQEVMPDMDVLYTVAEDVALVMVVDTAVAVEMVATGNRLQCGRATYQDGPFSAQIDLPGGAGIQGDNRQILRAQSAQRALQWPD